MITPTKEWLEVFKKTPGALSVTEAVAIMNIAALAPNGIYIELGTHKGKSGMSAAFTLKNGLFIMVDPILSDNTLFHSVCGAIQNSSIDGIDIESWPDYSLNIIPKYDNYSYVFVDSGSHQDGLPMEEAKLLEDRIVPGGIIAWHDFDSQFKEVREAYNYLLSTGKYEEISINWQEIVDYVNAENLEEGNESWHHAELRNPCFVGALKRK